MNHKNKDVHVYSKYRLVFTFLYIFHHIYTHHKHLQIKKEKQKNHNLIAKKHSFQKIQISIKMVPTSRKLHLSHLLYLNKRWLNSQ